MATLAVTGVNPDTYRPSAISEGMLLGTPYIRTASCACGLEIRAGDSDASVFAAVQAHNDLRAHRAWRYARELGAL